MPRRSSWPCCGLTLSCVWLSGVWWAGAADPPQLVKQTFTYKTVGEMAIQADVYRPAGAEVRPVVVWIHGGALILGSRTQFPRNLLEFCTEERLVFVSLDYRLAPEVKLPEIEADLHDAMNWLRNQGPTLFQADPRRVIVTGGSAGGFLTLLLGATEQPRPTALVAYWGYGDLDGAWATTPSEYYRTQTPLVDRDRALNAVGGKVLTNTDEPAVQQGRGNYYRYLRQTGGWSRAVTGLDAATEKSRLERFCPVRQITSDYPPLLMVHGTIDTDVPHACSADMDRALDRQGVPHELLTVPGAGHGLAGGDKSLVQAAHQRALAFIRERLK